MAEIVEAAPALDLVAARLGIGTGLRFFGGLILAALASSIADGILKGLSYTKILSIPFVGGAIRAGVEDSLVKPAEALFRPLEQVMSEVMYGIGNGVGVIGSNDLVLLNGLELSLKTLWHVAIPGFVKTALSPVRTIATEAKALAHTAEQTASRALSKADSIKVLTSGQVWHDIKGEVKTTAEAVVRPVAHEANTVSTEVAHAVGGAAAELPRLPGLGYDELNKLLGEADLTKLAGLLAAVPLLSSLIQSLTQEAGLTSAECRSKVGGICGVNPSAWEGLLASLAVAAFAFDLPAIVKAVNGLAPAATKIVKEAA